MARFTAPVRGKSSPSLQRYRPLTGTDGCSTPKPAFVRSALLVASVLVLSTASTLIVLRLRRQELHHGASKSFVIWVSLLNLVIFGLLALLVP